MYAKKSITIYFISLFISTMLYAQDHINATLVPGDVFGIAPSSKAWISTDSTDIQTYPVAIRSLNDNNQTAYGKQDIKVKALYDGKNLAFLLKWKSHIQDNNETNTTSVNLSVQFPQNEQTLPYVDMGYKNSPVLLYKLEATKNDQNISLDQNMTFNPPNSYKIDMTSKLFTAEGRDSMREIRASNKNYTINLTYKEGYYYASFTRVLSGRTHNLEGGLFSVSFSLQEYTSDRPNDYVNLSPWIAVQLSGEHINEELLGKLTEKISGDASRGSKIAYKNCSICHRYKDVKRAPKDMAPNLSYAGGLFNISYLRDSILHPSDIIVKDYSNQNDGNNLWQGKDDEGKDISTMPSFEWLSERDLNDLLAFLQTLK